MALTACEAFKLGFLSRCIEDGLRPGEIVQAVKQAEDKLAGLTDAVSNLVGKGLDLGVGYGVPLALAVPPVVGGLAGYGAAKALDIDDTAIADLKDKEVLDTYQRETARLKRQKAVRDYLAARKRVGRNRL